MPIRFPRPLVRLALAAALLAGSVTTAAFAQAGVGAKYGARDPRTCPSRTAPERGAPSPAQAAQYVACGQEGETGSGNLYLLENVRVQVGAGRPYQHVEDSFSDIDPRQTVYPIRGEATAYVCGALYTAQQVAAGWASNRGTNCAATRTSQMTGRCYRTTFADWRCTLGGGVDVGPMQEKLAPPQ